MITHRLLIVELLAEILVVSLFARFKTISD